MQLTAKPTLSIDRIRLVLPLMTNEATAAYFEHFDVFKADPFFKVKKIMKDKGGYVLAAKIPIGAKQLTMMLGWTHGHHFVSFDFKPEELGEEEIDALGSHFSYLPFMEDGLWLHATHVSYMELAADFPGRWVKDVLAFTTTRKTSRWIPNWDVPTPTQYLGRKSSGWELRIYDKAAELSAKANKAPLGKVLRIEAVISRTKLSPSALLELPNPFAKVSLAWLNDLHGASNDPGWAAFVGNCRKFGSGAAMSETGISRAVCLTRLQSCICDWWNPTELWQQYPLAVSKVTGMALHHAGSTVGPGLPRTANDISAPSALELNSAAAA